MDVTSKRAKPFSQSGKCGISIQAYQFQPRLSVDPGFEMIGCTGSLSLLKQYGISWGNFLRVPGANLVSKYNQVATKSKIERGPTPHKERKASANQAALSHCYIGL
jgi:hypothetical protein